MSTTTTPMSFKSIVFAAASAVGLTPLEVAGAAGIPYSDLIINLDQPNRFTVHQIASIALVVGLRVTDLVQAAL